MNSFFRIVYYMLDRIAPRPTAQRPNTPVSPPSPATPRIPSSGHVERKNVIFKEILPNQQILDSEESWNQHGTVMEGDTLKTKVITASRQLADADALESFCSICQKAESTTIRSAISHQTLCRTCQKILLMPDGKEIIVTPSEYKELYHTYDTWKALDKNLELPRR